jgi:hypothetical protein
MGEGEGREKKGEKHRRRAKEEGGGRRGKVVGTPLEQSSPRV